MTASIGTVDISRALLRTPRRGISHADVLVTGAAPPAAGTRATLAIGTRSMVGTVRPGGAFGGSAACSWVAGAGAWRTVVQAQSYHDDAGVKLSDVLRDLAADAGEIGAVLDVADRVLGLDWTRPTAPASDLLDALTGREWWIADDGMTHVGPRPATAIAPQGLSVDPYDPELRRAVVQLGDDGIVPLLPGAVLTAEGLPGPLTIGEVAVEVSESQVTVTLWGEATGAELLARIVDHLTAWRRYLLANPYTVDTVAGDGRVVVRPGDARASAFPDAPTLAHVPGIPGASYVLQHGAGVVVEHIAGDPGSPVCRGYPPGVLPLSILLDAASLVQVGGGPALPLVVAATSAWFTQMSVAMGQVVALLNTAGPVVGAPGTVTAVASSAPAVTTKAKGA